AHQGDGREDRRVVVVDRGDDDGAIDDRVVGIVGGGVVDREADVRRYVPIVDRIVHAGHGDSLRRITVGGREGQCGRADSGLRQGGAGDIHDDVRGWPRVA